MTLKIHSTEAERLVEYRICQERGHIESGRVDWPPEIKNGLSIIGSVPFMICKMCGTSYREETRIIESNKPEGAE